MFKTLINIFRIPELRNKVLFTLFMLAIYRIGFHVPIPGVDQEAFHKLFAKSGRDESAAGRIAELPAEEADHRIGNVVVLRVLSEVVGVSAHCDQVERQITHHLR